MRKEGIHLHNSTIGFVGIKGELYSKTEVPHIDAMVENLSVRPSSDIREYVNTKTFKQNF